MIRQLIKPTKKHITSSMIVANTKDPLRVLKPNHAVTMKNALMQNA
jgi:hypothetical protein